MKHSFWKRFLALVMAIAIVLSTGVLDSAGWLLANNGEDTTQEPTGENTAPPSDQQGGSSTETLDLTTEPTVESTGATDPSEGGETEDETTESTPVKEVTLTVVIQSVYADESQEGAVLGTEYLTYAEGEESKTIAVVIPAVEGYTFATDVAMTLNAEGKYEASLSRPAESGMLYITVTYSPVVPEGEEGTEPETPAEGEEPETPVEGEETTEPETPVDGEETTECVCPEDDCLLDECPACAAEDYSSCIFMQEFLGNGPAVGDLKPEDTTVYYTYTFEGDSEGKWTQIVKNGDTLELPEPPVQEGKAFVGWVDQDGNAVVAGPVTVSGTADKTITVSPSYRDVSYIYFQDNKGAICYTLEGIPGADMDGGEFAKAEAIAKGSISTTEKINGWKLEGTIVTAVKFPASGSITLVPEVVPGYWVEFDTDGGEFMEPVFKDSGTTLALPTPSKAGYVFAGWVNANGGAPVGGVSNGQATGSVSGACQLKATWTPSESTNYTVLYWMENADDEEYTYLDFDVKTGTTGAQTNAGAMENATTRFPDLKYCTLVTVEQQDIKADGSTIVNVYYDRNEYTVTYQGLCDLDEHTHSWQNGCYARKSTCNGRHSWYQSNSHTESESCYDLTNRTCTKTEHTHGTCDTKTVKAKWGADISDTWPGGNFQVSSTKKYQASINTMPTYNETFTLAYAEPEEDGNGGWIDADVAYYYMQKLDGTYGDGEGEVIPFPIEDGNWTITSDDAFGFTGFTYSYYVTDGKTYSGNNFGGIYDGAKFYYTRNSYDIELKYYDGTGAQVNGASKLTYKYQQPIPEGVLPAAGPAPQAGRGPDEGYTFKGWYWDVAGKEPVTLPETMPAYGLVVYAIWERQPVEANIYITVKTETNGVKKVMEVPYGYMLSEVTSVTEEQAAKGLLTYAQVQAALEAQNPGKDFLGWVTESGAPFLESTKITSAITLYPVFDGTGDAYTVTYVESGAEAAVVDLTKYRANSQAYIKAPVNATNTAGQKFSYWQGSDGLTYVPGQAVAISEDVTLTAVYAQPPVRASITYHSNTNTAADESWESGMIYLVNQKVTPGGYPADKPTKTGYSFAGWSLNANGAVVGTVVIDSRTNNNLYAVWVPNRNDVTYEYTNEAPEGASDVPAGKTEVAYGTEVSVEGNPTVPAGWAFSGWTTSDATVTDGKFSMPDNDVKFVGTWTKMDFTVTYEYTGEVPDGAPAVPVEKNKITMGTDYTVAADPEVDGYTFNGWLKDGEEVTSFEMPASDVTLIGSFSKRTDLGYIVKYVWGETELISTTKEVSNQTFGTTVTESAIDITGYTLNDDASKSITITTGENVIVFHYNKDVTFTGETAEKVYTGSEQTITKIDVSGLKTDHTYTGLTYAAKGTNVDTYDGVFFGDVIIKDEKGNDVTKYYNVTKTPGTLTITKASLNLVITGNSDEKVYNGSEQEVTGFTSEGLLTGHKITDLTHVAKGTNVGEYTGSFTGTVKVMDGETDVTQNYAITQNPGKLTITRSSDWTLTVVGYDGVYDAQTHAVTVTPSVTEGTIIIYSIDGMAWTDTLPTITDVGEVRVKVRAENPNYTPLEEGAILTVTPAPLTIVTPDADKVYDGTALTAAGKIEGFVNGETATFAVTGSQTAVGSSDNTYSLVWDGTAKASNYTISETIGTLTVTEYAQEIVVTTTGGTFTYDGKAHGATVEVSELPKGYTLETAASTATATDVTTEAVPATADILVIKNAAGEDVTSKLKIKYVDGTIVINPRSVTLTSATDSKTYDGTPLTNSEVTVGGDGFVEGEGANYNVTGTITDVGSVDNAFTYTLKDGTKADNYKITVNFGKLTIDKVTTEIVITADSNSKTYDGQPLTDDGYTYTQNVLAEGDELTAVVEGSQTDVGTADNVVTSYKVMRGETDVTANYTFGASVKGTLTVTKRSVTLTSATDSKQYDGTPLTNGTVTITGDGFATGEGAAWNVTGSQLTVDSSANSFTYTLNEGTNADNYNITKVEGTLTVTDRDAKFEITVEANSGEFKYDGTEKNVSGFKTLTFTVNGQTYTVEGLSASNTQTDAGTYTVEITGTAVVKDAAGNDVTAQFTVTEVDGKLVINKREVTLTSATDSKEYDGTALTNDEVTVSGDGFAANEGATYDVTGSQLTVGSSENEFTYTLNEGTKADNYNINKVEGTLTVTDRDAKFEIIVVANSDEFTYDGTEKNVTGFETLTFTVSGQTYTVEGLTASETQTQAGTYTVKITGTAVVKDANGNDVTAQFIVNKENGELVINPAEITVTITGNTESKVYNGSEQMVEGYEVEISNKLYTEADFSFSGTDVVKGTDVGTYPMGLAEDQFTNNNDNFTVTFVVTDGQLEITPVTDKVTVTITEHKGTEVYKGDAYTVSGYDVAISNPLYSELDIVFSGTASVSGTVVGTYDMGLKPENFANINENFTNVEFVIEDGQLVINPLEVTVTITENSDTKVYNGAEQKVEGYKVTSISNDLFKEEMIVFAGEAVAKGTVVGTYDMNLTPDQFSSSDAKNFTVTFEIVDGQLEITPVTDKVTVTITEHSGTEKYDGTEKTVTGYDVDIDNELYFEKDFTFSGNATGKGTNAGTYEMALKAADFSNISKNFTNVEFVIVDGKLEITKRSVTLTSADDEKVYDGTALTNSEVTVSGDGFVTGEGATYDVTGTQTAEGSSENEFTYTLNANTLADNYDITVEFGTLKVTALTDEIVVTITEHSGEYKYDGKEKTVSGYDVEISSKLYTEDDFTFSGDATVSGTDAGTYEMKLSPEDFTNTSKNFEKVTFVIVDGDLEINKREVTMTSATDSKVYDGTALTNDTVTVTGDGFATGEGATYDVTGSQTEFGTSSNSFTYTLNEGTKADNYIIETVEGTLTVTASQKTVTVTITENSDTVMYDGAEHSVKGYEVTGISDPLYTVNDFSFSGNATVSGTDAGTYDMELTADMFKNISTNFSNVEFEIVDGTLEITKRTVTMTSATDSKVYDGTALTNDTVTVTGDGFAEKEGATYDVTGTQTENGTSSNTFTYTLNEGTKADNYIIKTVEGTLTVTAITDKVTVVITENSGEATYDGTQHTVTGYEVTSISNPLYTVDDFTFSGNAAVNAVDAGVYDMLLTSGNFTNKSPNFANVEFVIVDGQLTINKRNVTLTSASDSKEYDGIALTAKTVEITAGSFAPNEGYTVNITGSQTLVGKSDNTFTYALTQNTKSGNYEITVVYGELQVTDRTEPFAVVVEANSGEHVYDGQPFTVSGLKEATVARMAARIDGQTVTFLLNGETYTISGLHAERTETHVNPAAPTAVDVLPYSGYEVAISGTPVITDSEGNDVTKQFTVETISGLLTIHPAPVTMVSGDATKPYDGTELINHEVTATGFVEGEGAEYAVTGTQTLVGSSENAFTYTLNEGTQAQDYRIETTFGTLTVTAPEDYEIIDKTHTTETLYRLGDTVTFDITVKNIFSEEAKVVITEQEGVSILWNGQKVQSVETTIPAGETITLQAEYTLQEKDILAGEYTNVVDANIKATVDKIPYEGDDDDDDKVDEIEDPKAKLTLDKVTTSTPANGSKYVAGETITYQITATNSGNLTLHDVVIYDLLTGESQSKYAVETDPVEYTFELDVNLAPGESATVTYTHTVTEEDLGKNLINAVTGSAGNSSETDDEEKNDTPTEIIPDEVKDPTDDIRRDLDVEKNVLNYQDPYRLGSFIEYEIVVTNRGNVTERDVIVTDIVDSRGGAYYLSFTDLGGGLLLPGNRVQIPSIAPGETVTILCHYWIGADDEALPVNNKAVVESADGETDDEDDAETVMVEKLYTLTIYYLTDDWQTVLAPEYHDRYSVGYTYYVESPEIEGYEANYKAIWSGWDGMPEHDVVCYVLYSKLPEETTEPTTEPTDPSEETTEPTTAPTEPTYDLTEIPEEEVPLGDVDLGDHTCCIMHFLIMLVAMILLGFYTNDRKKYQERIHELKRSLAAEDAAGAAAGEEQA